MPRIPQDQLRDVITASVGARLLPLPPSLEKHFTLGLLDRGGAPRSFELAIRTVTADTRVAGEESGRLKIQLTGLDDPGIPTLDAVLGIALVGTAQQPVFVAFDPGLHVPAQGRSTNVQLDEVAFSPPPTQLRTFRKDNGEIYRTFPGNLLADVLLSGEIARGFSSAEPTADRNELDRRTRAIRACGVPAARPVGCQSPSQVATSAGIEFARDPAVRAWVLSIANGICEFCGQPAPFVGADGAPFLEVHHPRLLSQGGPDTPENVVAVCPNCHRRLHHGAAVQSDLVQLRNRVPRLV